MRIAAHTIGVDADAALHRGRPGVIAASFARSCYVRFGDDWVCIGHADIGSGPLNVPCRGDSLPDWRALAPPGGGARVAGDALLLDERVQVVLAGAPVWRAPRRPRWTDATLARGLAGLARRSPADLPTDGLAGLLQPGPRAQGPVARAALPALAQLHAWIARPGGGPSMAGDIARSLVGLGPGLTPSGDDFLAGCLVALRLAGRHARADELWAAVAAHAHGGTHAISHAHLRAAARGRAGEGLHRVLDAVLEGDTPALDGAMDRLRRQGNHSPWDFLAGSCAVLRALAASGRRVAGERSQPPALGAVPQGDVVHD